MVFWVVLRAPSTLRFVQPVIERLAADGHRLHVTFALPGSDVDWQVAELCKLPRIEVSHLALEQPGTLRFGFAQRVLQPLRDFASYCVYRRRWGALMRQRWFEYFPRSLALALRAAERVGLARALEIRPARALALRAARSWPVPPALKRQLKAVAPDVVIASPMIYSGSREVDALRAARAAGIPTVGVVLSWDNLTSKGLFHARPDRLIVWNETQVDEAVSWHGFDRSRVEALGAPAFDYLFGGAATARAEFLDTLGLQPEDRYVVYGVSSRLGLGPGGELDLVSELAAAIAETDLKPKPVLVVRPHPKNVAGWDRLHLPGVTVWRRPGFPDSEQAKADLRDTLAHADAVIGLNTSLFIDAAVVGTPTIALLLRNRAFADRVPSRIAHFGYLLQSGILETVDDVRDAAHALLDLQRIGDPRGEQRRAFVESFVRPRGFDVSAAEIVAQRLASLGG